MGERLASHHCYLLTAGPQCCVNRLRPPPIPDIRHSFDHLVGAREQGRRHGEAERLSSLEIDHKLKLGGHLNRQFTRLHAPQDAIHVRRGATEEINVRRAIGQQVAVPD